MLFEFFTFVNVETHFTQLTPWVQVEKGIRDASILFYACNVVTVESNYTTFKEILISWLRWGLRRPPGPKCPLFVTICSPLPLFHFQRPNVLFIVNHVDPHVNKRKAFYLLLFSKLNFQCIYGFLESSPAKRTENSSLILGTRVQPITDTDFACPNHSRTPPNHPRSPQKVPKWCTHWERFCNITESWPRLTISFHCLLPEANRILNSESKSDSADIPLHGIWVQKIIWVHMTTVPKHAIVDILAVFQLQPMKLYLILKLNFVSRLCL